MAERSTLLNYIQDLSRQETTYAVVNGETCDLTEEVVRMRAAAQAVGCSTEEIGEAEMAGANQVTIYQLNIDSNQVFRT